MALIVSPQPALADIKHAKLTRTYGVQSELLERLGDFANARATTSGLPTLIDLRLDPCALPFGRTLEAAPG